MNKKLYRSNDRKLFGVCGGIAEYFGWDPTAVRIIWAIFSLSGGVGIMAYILGVLLMDNRPGYVSRYEN